MAACPRGELRSFVVIKILQSLSFLIRLLEQCVLKGPPYLPSPHLGAPENTSLGFLLLPRHIQVSSHHLSVGKLYSLPFTLQVSVVHDILVDLRRGLHNKRGHCHCYVFCSVYCLLFYFCVGVKELPPSPLDVWYLSLRNRLTIDWLTREKLYKFIYMPGGIIRKWVPNNPMRSRSLYTLLHRREGNGGVGNFRGVVNDF